MDNTKKVLIIEENSFVPVDRRVWYEAVTLRDAGWQVAVICPEILATPTDGDKASHRSFTPEVLDGIMVYRFPLLNAQHGIFSYLREYLTAFLAIARCTWQVWQAHHFNVIHFCNPPDIFSPLAVFYRWLGVSVIFDHHDLFPELVLWRYHGIASRLLYIAARLGEYLMFKSADVVLSTNQSYRNIAITRGSFPAERVVVVRNGPKKDEFTPVEPVPDLKRGFPYMVAYAGVMGPEDGVFELLQSIRHIVTEHGHRNILFVLLGDGAVRTRVRAETVSLGIDEVVDFPGMIHDDLLLRQYLSTADLLLSPEPLTPLNLRSTFIKVGEYMAMGKPIVAYQLPETEYTAKGAAVYIEPGNTQAYSREILALLDNPQRRQWMGEIGRKRVLESLSWECQQAELLRAYTLALNRRARIGPKN